MENPGPASDCVAQISREFSLLSIYGGNLILSFAEVLATGILYGIYMVLTLGAIIILWRRKDGIARARVTLGLSVVILFLLTTADICCTMVFYIASVQSILVNDVGTPTRAKNNAYLEKYRGLGDMHDILFPVAFILGDAIVIWRACVLSGGKRKIVFLLVVLHLALTGAASGFIGCLVDAGMSTSATQCRPALEVTYALSVVTNVAATAVIGYTTW
ncbi:hypothetical protein PM082_000028 [Marasmius tenuissimus]|nr:hypothetical protein PM082_000028 [Marasmius tenuissimus]